MVYNGLFTLKQEIAVNVTTVPTNSLLFSSLEQIGNTDYM